METAHISKREQPTIDEDNIRQVEATIFEDHHITVLQLAQERALWEKKIIHDHLHMPKLPT